MYQLEGEENMITKTQFKDAVKKTIICTIMNQPEIIYNLDQEDFIKDLLKNYIEKEAN